MQSPFEVLIWPSSLSSKPSPSKQMFCPLFLGLKTLKPWMQGGRKACLKLVGPPPLSVTEWPQRCHLACLPCKASVAVELRSVSYDPVPPVTFMMKLLREEEEAVRAGKNEEVDNLFKFF